MTAQQGNAGDEVPTQWHTRTDRAPGDPPSGQRIEPGIDESAFQHGPSSAYERLHGLGPEFGESGYQPPARSRLWRIMTMASVFIVGAGVGLAAAWWLHKPSSVAPVSATAASSARNTPAAPVANVKRSATVRGISPSELPYDGAPPPTATETAPEPAASPRPALPETSSGASVASSSGERNSGGGETDVESAMPAAPPAAAQKSAPRAESDEEPKTAGASRPAKQGGASVASAAPKRKSVARSDREIERIRRQVDEELKKKTEQGRSVSPGAGQGARNERGSRRDAATSGGVARVSSIRASLARCDKKSNFIRREFCRWQVCNGSWGKNGCPSYQQQASTY